MKKIATLLRTIEKTIQIQNHLNMNRYASKSKEKRTRSDRVDIVRRLYFSAIDQDE